MCAYFRVCRGHRCRLATLFGRVQKVIVVERRAGPCLLGELDVVTDRRTYRSTTFAESDTVDVFLLSKHLFHCLVAAPVTMPFDLTSATSASRVSRSPLPLSPTPTLQRPQFATASPCTPLGPGTNDAAKSTPTSVTVTTDVGADGGPGGVKVEVPPAEPMLPPFAVDVVCGECWHAVRAYRDVPLDVAEPWMTSIKVADNLCPLCSGLAVVVEPTPGDSLRTCIHVPCFLRVH